MTVMTDYWKYFENTGSIENYLAYREQENCTNEKDKDDENESIKDNYEDGE